MGPVEHRRSFLFWAINGLGALFAVVLGFPVVSYVIDPRNRKGAAGNMKLADGVRLGDFSLEKPVQQGVIRDVRRDAWTLYPNDVVGRVWVVLQPGKQIPASADERRRLASHIRVELAPGTETEREFREVDEAPIRVFTTICPHLGCSINRALDSVSFVCPCHAATFSAEGERMNFDHNPAQRGMDSLQWVVDPSDPEANRILVQYLKFKSSVAEKTVLT